MMPVVNHAIETRMVFMFAGRVNMRASPRTGGAFFQHAVRYTIAPASTGADGNRGGRESRMNGKKEGDEKGKREREREEMPPPSNLSVSRHISRKEIRKECEILENHASRHHASWWPRGESILPNEITRGLVTWWLPEMEHPVLLINNV